MSNCKNCNNWFKRQVMLLLVKLTGAYGWRCKHCGGARIFWRDL